MAVLDVPLNLPAGQMDRFLKRELRYAFVTSMKVHASFARIEYQPMSMDEIIADQESCERASIFV